jgi:hypothetical protein
MAESTPEKLNIEKTSAEIVNQRWEVIDKETGVTKYIMLLTEEILKESEFSKEKASMISDSITSLAKIVEKASDNNSNNTFGFEAIDSMEKED